MKKYEVVYSQDAILDLDDVWEQVAVASKDYDVTVKYLNEIQDTIEEMASRPKTGIPLYYGDMFTGYYHVNYKEYMAFYRIEESKMLVDIILYAKMDYIRKLGL
ncbi:MAG: type II toxin-antitoxin system RelE/ParE family toxin [Butyrivibrio sp.]|nr:type II toxin-antitoxin system RelE/ParE family toxin [Butyrivibrio sp.]